MKELCSREFGYVWFNALPSKPTLINPTWTEGGQIVPPPRAPVSNHRKTPSPGRVNTGGVVAYGVSLELSVRQEFGCFSRGFRKKPGHKRGTPFLKEKT